MKINETKVLQEQRLKEISILNGIEFSSLKTLLESVKTKKLLKRNNKAFIFSIFVCKHTIFC